MCVGRQRQHLQQVAVVRLSNLQELEQRILEERVLKDTRTDAHHTSILSPR